MLGFRFELTVTGSRDERIAAVAGLQRGYVARRQLLAIGVSYRAIARSVHAGRLHPCRRGVYAVGHRAEVALGPETSALLAVRDGAALSHGSAAALWGMRGPDPPDQVVHIVVGGNQAAAAEGVHVHRTQTLAAADLRIRDRVPVTSPARTIIDMTPGLADRRLELMVDGAITERVVREVELRQALDRLTRAPGRSRLIELLGHQTHASVTRSRAEERLLGVIRKARLPEPLLNAQVAGHEVDFYWPQARLVLEIDGFQFHSTRRRLERDRRKDDDLTAAGMSPIRATARQAERDAVAIVVQVGQALTRAGAA